MLRENDEVLVQDWHPLAGSCGVENDPSWPGEWVYITIISCKNTYASCLSYLYVLYRLSDWLSGYLAMPCDRHGQVGDDGLCERTITFLVTLLLWLWIFMQAAIHGCKNCFPQIIAVLCYFLLCSGKRKLSFSKKVSAIQKATAFWHDFYAMASFTVILLHCIS